MDVTALSIVNSLNQTQSAVGVQLLKTTMDSEQTMNSNLLSLMVPPSPTLGTKVDISA